MCSIEEKKIVAVNMMCINHHMQFKNVVQLKALLCAFRKALVCGLANEST